MLSSNVLRGINKREIGSLDLLVYDKQSALVCIQGV